DDAVVGGTDAGELGVGDVVPEEVFGAAGFAFLERAGLQLGPVDQGVELGFGVRDDGVVAYDDGVERDFLPDSGTDVAIHGDNFCAGVAVACPSSEFDV